MQLNKILTIDALSGLKMLNNESIDCCATSPPYWSLRDYGVDGQIGLEDDFQDYIINLCNIFDEVKRVLKKEGTCWVVLDDTHCSHQGDPNKVGGLEGKRIHDDKNFADSVVMKRKNVFDKDKYNGKNGRGRGGNVPDKSLCLVPFRFAIEMVNRGWSLRNTVIWHKNNSMPESVKDRFTIDFEYVFFFTKNRKYYFEQQFEPCLSEEKRENGCERNRLLNYNSKFNALHKKNGLRYHYRGNTNPDYLNPKGRNKRAVWNINTKPLKESHYAPYPEELVRNMIKAGCPANGIVLDPFIGSGTTACVAKRLGRNFIGFDINPAYVEMARKRIGEVEMPIYCT